MDEISFLVQQRIKHIKEINMKINQLKEMSQEELEMFKQNEKQLKNKLKKQQKMRIQKENWIINILRSIKVLDLEKKKQFLYQSQKIMSKFQQLNQSEIINQLETQNNFTEQFVNLYAIFFKKLQSKFQFKISIKHIIRPNNKTIITDLIKYLLEFTRDQFKHNIMKLKLILYPDNPILIDNNSIVFPIRSEKMEKSKQKIIKNSDQPKQLVKETNQIKKFTPNQQILNLDECNRMKIPLRTSKLKKLQQLAISIFLNLKDKNTLIKNSIEQWRFLTFGMDKKNLIYDFNNLYTKSEIQQIQQKIASKHQQSVPRTYFQKQQQLKKFWRQLVNCQTNKQRQVRKRIIKPINPKINFIINLRFDHKFPLQILLLQQIRNNNYLIQRNLSDLQKIKQRLSIPISKNKQRNNQQGLLKISPSIFVKKTIDSIVETDKQYLNPDEKKMKDSLYIQHKFNIQKMKSDVMLPSIQKTQNNMPKSEEQNQRKNYSSKSSKSKLELIQQTKIENKYNYANINQRTISKLKNVSVNLIKLVHFNVR